MNTWEEVMSDKITVEEMVKDLDRFIKYADMHLPFLRAIRSHLTESDIAHWMDRCHELEVELAELTKKLSEVKFDVQNPNRLDMEKPKVSRVFLDYQKYPLYKDEVIKLLIEYGIEVSDES